MYVKEEKPTNALSYHPINLDFNLKCYNEEKEYEAISYSTVCEHRKDGIDGSLLQWQPKYKIQREEVEETAICLEESQ